MRNAFNIYARPLALDLTTAIPRCYRAVFNTVAPYDNPVQNPTPVERAQRYSTHARAGLITGIFGGTGIVYGGATTLVVALMLSPGTFLLAPALILGVTAGAASGAAWGMQAYTGQEAFPELNKAKAEQKLEP